jgi:glutathione peroxidase
VNTASDCGYTAQLAELEELQQKYAQQLTILAFPSNDFKEQEKGTDAEIAAFARRTTIPVFRL